MDQLLVDRPGWLDWPWVLRVLDQEIRVTGEEVRPAEGTVATACLVAEEPLVVTVTGGGGHLAVTPPAPALGELVTRRFHLDLDGNAVDTALGRSTLARLFDGLGGSGAGCQEAYRDREGEAAGQARGASAGLQHHAARTGTPARQPAAGWALRTWRRRSPGPGTKPRRVSHAVIQSGDGWPAGTTL